MVSEIRQTEENKQCMISLIYKTEPLETGYRLVAARGGKWRVKK